MISGFFFLLFAVMLVASAVGTLMARQPVHSVLFLIFAFFNGAGVFLTLGAEFLAFILLIVYIGAVAVLFLFVVMMLDVREGPGLPPLRRFGKAGLALGGVMIAQMVALALSWPAMQKEQVAEQGAAATQALGRVLYTDYMLPFQLSGLVLLVAIIGAIVLTHGPRRAVKRQNPVAQTVVARQDVVELRRIGIGEGAE